MRGCQRSAGALAALLVLLSGAAASAEGSRLANETELSVLDASGNTEVTTVNAKNKLTYSFSDATKGTWQLGARYGESGGEKSAESYLAEVRAEHLLTDRIYAAATVGWLRDEFAGIDARWQAGPSVGYKAVAGPAHFLTAEAGLGFVAEDYTDGTDSRRLDGRAGAKYEYALGEKSRFSQALEYRHDFEDADNYAVSSETALVSSLGGRLALKTSYLVAYDHRPVPASLERTDRTLAVTLVVTY